MTKEIECPLCEDSKAVLMTAPYNAVFKGSFYSIRQYYYYCSGCFEEFMTEESVKETLKQIPNYPI